jgi:hypothetical protein
MTRRAKKGFKKETEQAMVRKLVVILRRGRTEAIQAVSAVINGLYFKMEAEARRGPALSRTEDNPQSSSGG